MVLNPWLPTGTGLQLLFIRLCLALLLGLTGTSVHAVEKTSIRVGLFNNQPIVFETSPGKYAGLSVDVLQAIAVQEDVGGFGISVMDREIGIVEPQRDRRRPVPPFHICCLVRCHPKA